AALMQLGQRLCDRKPQSRPLMALGELAFDLLEWAAKPRQSIGWDANTGIRNRDAHPAACRARANGDAASFGSELHRVGKEIEYDLLEQTLIGVEADIRSDAREELQALVIGSRRDHADRVVKEALQVDLLGIEPDSSGLDLRHVENVVDHFE